MHIDRGRSPRSIYISRSILYKYSLCKKSIRVYIDLEKYIDRGLRPWSIYFADFVLGRYTSLRRYKPVSTSYKGYICIILYFTFLFSLFVLLAQPVNITLYEPGLDCLVFDSVPERYLHHYFRCYLVS